MVVEKKPKCFISAPIHTDTSVVRGILAGKGVEAYDAYDFRPGDPIQDALSKKIQEADFVIVVISELNANVFYELGLSEGKGKPIFLIIGKDVDVPHFLLGKPYFRGDVADRDLLAISLSRFTDELLSKRRKLPKRKGRRKSESERLQSINEYIQLISELRAEGNARKVEDLAQKIFEKLSVQFESSQFVPQDKGVDFAIWSNDLAFTIGNPIFVELKYGSLTPGTIYRAEDQLKEYLSKSDAKAAILLYLDREGKRFPERYSLSPLIIRLDFEDFVKSLSKHSFTEALLDARNRIVHGVSA
jgi:hypothetical protein